MRQFFVVACALVAGVALAASASGCRKPSADRERARPPAAGGGSGSGSGAAAGSAAPDPWAAKSAPRPPDTAEVRQRRAEAALARVAKIEPEVARLRNLTFERAVPTRYQQADEFRAFVRREIAKDLPPERSRDQTAALAHLGFLAEPTDIASVLEQAMTTQAGAYYDPVAKAFFVVMVPDNDLLLDTMSAHELTHALQDQHFNLEKYLPSGSGLDDDAISARRFVVEGDATFLMSLYAMHGMVGETIPPPVLAMLRDQITASASESLDALKAQVRAQSALVAGMDGDIKKSIDAMDDIPPAVLVPLLDSYTKGALVALTAYDRGGWLAVDSLYRDPPTSTEQVLHPETKLFPRRERPHRIRLARTADQELAGNVLGELQWRVYFEQWKVPQAADAAAGWAGDRYSVTRRKDGRLIGRIATLWDSPAEASQFAEAYLASAAARFPGADVSAPATAGIARPDGGKLFVRRDGARVIIVDGADDAGELAAAARTAVFE